VKYEDLYYNDAYTEHVGYYAHIGVDLTFSNPQFWDGGYELANFPGFFFQQKACYEDGVGCYPTTTKVDGVEMLKHSFAGTSAANGGLPLNFQYGSGDNTIYPIGVYYSSYLEDYDWNNCYVEYDITTHNRNTYNGWWSDYDWENDWSYEAHCYGRLSLMINPAYHYPTKEAYESGVMSGELSGEISYNMPVIWSKYLSINYNTTNYKDKTALTILSSTTSVTIPLDKVSMATGIEEVEGDLTAGDGEAVYYNLQGIRVTNPERGQIYIVRRGNTTTKCLFK
jgi:hypothetical protein